jgi:hypothetical protein
MIELEKAFAELPLPAADSRDAEAARRIWLRARVASVTETRVRLRFVSVALLFAAFDAITVLLVAAAVYA